MRACELLFQTRQNNGKSYNFLKTRIFYLCSLQNPHDLLQSHHHAQDPLLQEDLCKRNFLVVLQILSCHHTVEAWACFAHQNSFKNKLHLAVHRTFWTSWTSNCISKIQLLWTVSVCKLEKLAELITFPTGKCTTVIRETAGNSNIFSITSEKISCGGESKRENHYFQCQTGYFTLEGKTGQVKSCPPLPNMALR